MAAGSKSSKDRVERERARAYAARTELYEKTKQRRKRDNILSGVVGGLLLLGIIGAQTAYFVAGPGKPTPEPTPISTTDTTPTPGNETGGTDAPAPEATTPAPVAPTPVPTSTD